MDHDQRFKLLLQEFFADFLRLFFAAWAVRFDLDAVEWLTNEVFPDPPQGQRRVLDLVARLPLRQPASEQRPGEGERFLALPHVEIESAETTVPLKSSLHEAYEQLRRRSGLPVLPVAVYLRVGLKGLGVDAFVERFFDLEVVRFQYLYVGLPGLPAEPYRAGDNILGVALSALMQMPREERAQAALDALRRVVQSPENAWRKFLLGDCILAYSPLDEDQRQEFERQVQSGPFKEIKMARETWYDQGMRRGEARILEHLLERRFGPLPPTAKERLQALPEARLLEVGEALLQGRSLRELGLED